MKNKILGLQDCKHGVISRTCTQCSIKPSHTHTSKCKHPDCNGMYCIGGLQTQSSKPLKEYLITFENSNFKVQEHTLKAYSLDDADTRFDKLRKNMDVAKLISTEEISLPANSHDALIKACQACLHLAFKHQIQYWLDAKGTDAEKLGKIVNIMRDALDNIDGKRS